MSIELSSPVNASVQPSVMVREYEFDAYENAVIERLASRLTTLGYTLMTAIALHALVAALGARRDPSTVLSAVIQGLILGLLAASVLRASRSLKEVVRTEGQDISHLITALGALTQAYSAQGFIVALSALGLALTAVVLAMT